jgi:hypothetical protein
MLCKYIKIDPSPGTISSHAKWIRDWKSISDRSPSMIDDCFPDIVSSGVLDVKPQFMHDSVHRCRSSPKEYCRTILQKKKKPSRQCVPRREKAQCSFASRMNCIRPITESVRNTLGEWETTQMRVVNQ